ncbi:MAG: hypothetical protein WC401_10235 [Bacteroidales bacterium]|jgi:hypothetical protein
MKSEKIQYRLENAIRRNWGRKGYWKHQIAMILAYEIGSLSEAWKQVNDMVAYIISKWQPREPMLTYVQTDPGNYGIGCGNYTGD